MIIRLLYYSYLLSLDCIRSAVIKTVVGFISSLDFESVVMRVVISFQKKVNCKLLFFDSSKFVVTNPLQKKLLLKSCTEGFKVS